VTDLKNNGFRIRDARQEELNKVSQLLKIAFQQYEKFIPSEVWQSYLENIMDVHSRVADAGLIVAELKGVLVGTVTLYLHPSHSTEEGWPPGWAGVRLLGVDPGYRGKGIGGALMEECIRRCRKYGIKTIGLHTSEIMDVARRMYEQMGFIRVPEFDFHPSPDVVIMAYRFKL
jgi:GNAT superfamily N-acetyltransferase